MFLEETKLSQQFHLSLASHVTYMTFNSIPQGVAR